MELKDLGWNDFFEQHFSKIEKPDCVPGRIAREHKGSYLVYTENGEFNGKVSGRFRYETPNSADFPSVGDWVAAKTRPDEGIATIHFLLPRSSKFSRKAVLSGRTEEQILAANIDMAFLVSGLDGDFNLRRIERYVTITWDSGATPVIILNKMDLCDHVASIIEKVENTISGVAILAVSASEDTGLENLEQYLPPGTTVAFLGSSGVGKSSIINRLLGYEKLRTRAVREYDNKGAHTTTHREMILLPNGGIVIDTPGMREIQMWSDEEGINSSFGDIEALMLQCRFSDCHHGNEPGCAIQTALSSGDLDIKRFLSYNKLQSELQNLTLLQDEKANRRAGRAWQKKVNKAFREREKLKEDGLL